MKKNKKDTFYREKQKLANKYRVEVLNIAVNAEFLISQILINFFGTREEVKSSVRKYLFSDTLTFEKKINLFNSLHKKEVFIDSTKEVRSDLMYLKKLRNYMAHSELAFNFKEYEKESDQNFLTFISFNERKGEEIIRVNLEGVEEDPDRNIFSRYILYKKQNNLRKKLGVIYNSLL